MNINPRALISKITLLLAKGKQYMSFIFVLIALGIFGFLLLRIRGYVVNEPSDAAVTEKLGSLPRPRIDQTTLDKLQQLEDNNVQVKALFEQARDNPFQE